MQVRIFELMESLEQHAEARLAHEVERVKLERVPTVLQSMAEEAMVQYTGPALNLMLDALSAKPVRTFKTARQKVCAANVRREGEPSFG